MGHALYFPKGYPKFYKDEEDKSVILTLTEKLLPEEEASEFAKYYHLGACAPSKETLDMMTPEKELPKEAAFMPEDYAKIMLGSVYTDYENGYRVMDNGVAFVALRTWQEGVTDENMQFFNDHFSPEPADLFYKTWCPGTHMRLYPDLAIEDMGWGWLEVRITGFLGKEDFGLPENMEELDPDLIDFQAMNIEVLPLGAPEGTEPVHLVEANYFRQTMRGREIRHRFWIGLNIENGKSAVTAVKDRELAAEYARKTAYHSGSEFATLARNVLQFWADRH